MSQLLPDGIAHLADLPWPLWDALRTALGYLDFDELPSDERPPRHIWAEHDLLRDHFETVKKIRDMKMGGKGDIRDEEIDGEVAHNALADGLLV